MPDERGKILERRRELPKHQSSLAGDGREPSEIFFSADSEGHLDTVSEMSEHSLVQLVGEKGTVLT